VKIIDKRKSDSPVFLLEKYRINYVQSASLFSILLKYYRRDRETKSFIGFGDPVYDYENFKQNKPEQGTFARASTDKEEIKQIFQSRYARAGGIMNRLPRSGEEVKTIAALFAKQSQKSIVYSRVHATETNAKVPEMKEFDYIHLACHGLLNDEFQSLVLSQIPGAREDGYFTLNEIMNCDYNAKLVVLSACRTGSGKMERGEGVTGLTRAVMYAGTPAVVASLWDVDDNATKELMILFFRNMLETNMDKVEALRQAKLMLLKNEKYRSPLFWSAFVMYGE
jgi:CHAT domain-containing protein